MNTAQYLSPRRILDQPLRYLRGVGPQRALALEKLGLCTAEDLLYHLPRAYQDRSRITPIAQATPGGTYLLSGEIEKLRSHTAPGRRIRGWWTASLRDESGELEVVWFNQPYVGRQLSDGQRVVMWGKVDFHAEQLQLTTPEWEALEGEDAGKGEILPIYPSGEGLHQKALRTWIRTVADQVLDTLPDPLPTQLVMKYELLSLGEALRSLHFPDVKDEQWEAKVERAKQRLIYDDFFWLQLILAERRSQAVRIPGALFTVQANSVSEQFLAQLPFQLTGDQQRVIEVLRHELSSGRRLNRLLQGDVGSGKTVVFLCALLLAVENGYQGAVMAPTEVLSQQHAATMRELLNGLKVPLHLLYGGLSAAARREALEYIRTGAPGIVVGTHALFQEGVEFRRLGMVVIDEQHKFGVAQRAQLEAKGQHPHVMVTSATPIPRTLALTFYGDLELLLLKEMPPGRLPIKTATVSLHKRDAVYKRVRQEVEQGHQAYIVYPLIEESEQLPNLFAVTERFKFFEEEVFQDLRLGLLHGRMSSVEKEQLARDFRAGKYDILVSTTVIEVGIDNPNATLMLIENAERFGLAQLHQLRGRVGRGPAPSFCVLLTGEKVTKVARARLKVMESTPDGFVIAEEDLRLRGPGELMGWRQAGQWSFRVADPVRDELWLLSARDDAFQLVQADPRLAQPEHSLLREHLAHLSRQHTLDIA